MNTINKINSNRGMFLETLINQTAWYYSNNQISLIFKRHIPIKIFERKDNVAKVKLESNALTDYYGVYKGQMIDFEAKQITTNSFTTANIKKHQREHLINCKQHGVIAFIIINFTSEDLFFAIDIDTILPELNKTKIKLDWFKQNSFQLQIIFPGILNINEYIEYVIKHKYK
ncbi:MAG: Holliday junction resolvase RecU [Mycoplasma sp.]